MDLKKLTFAFFVSVAMVAAAPSAMAKPAGKIENKTPEATVIAIDDTIERAKETLEAIKSDGKQDDVMEMFKVTKQTAKTIESTVTYSIREKALGRLGKARTAFNHGADKAEVVELMQSALDTFVELKDKYHSFDGS